MCSASRLVKVWMVTPGSDDIGARLVLVNQKTYSIYNHHILALFMGEGNAGEMPDVRLRIYRLFPVCAVWFRVRLTARWTRTNSCAVKVGRVSHISQAAVLALYFLSKIIPRPPVTVQSKTAKTVKTAAIAGQVPCPGMGGLMSSGYRRSVIPMPI